MFSLEINVDQHRIQKKKEITTMNICHKYQGKHQSIYFILFYFIQHIKKS
jgi:hypothetical protein